MSFSLCTADTQTRPYLASPSGPRTVWRTWLVRPMRLGTDPEPILTGVFGFPWREPELDAKCAIQDLDTCATRPGPVRVDRHHPTIPHPGCTCGIYASTDLLATPATDLLPAATPVVTGFVELSGRLLTRGSVVRAQHARIIGPLTIGPGRPPLTVRLARRAGLSLEPTRVALEEQRYRVVWGAGRIGETYDEWLAAAASGLSSRYRVSVVVT